MDLLRPFKGGWATAAAAATAPEPAVASVDVGTVRHRFNWEWATGDNDFDGDTYWWWARSIRVDPNEVIADDDEGNLWSVPFTTDGTDQITFGAPVRVAETFVPVQAGEGHAATEAVRRRRQRVLAMALDRPDKPRSNNQAAAASAPDNERTPMDATVLQALARQHGLDPETATEDQVNAAVMAADTNPIPEADNPAGGTLEETPAPELVAAAQAATAAEGLTLRELLGLPATATDEQVVTATRELQAGAQAGASVARQAIAAELDRTVDDAVSDGRIAPSARDAWRSAIDPGDRADAAATARASAERDRLNAMATNRVPVHERGTARTTQDGDQPASLTRALAASGLTRNKSQEVTRRG